MICAKCKYYGDACPCGNGHGDEQHPDDDACVLGDRLAELEAEVESLKEHRSDGFDAESNALDALRDAQTKAGALEVKAAKWEKAARRLAEYADDVEGQCKRQTGEPFTPDEWIVYALSTTQAPGE